MCNISKEKCYRNVTLLLHFAFIDFTDFLFNFLTFVAVFEKYTDIYTTKIKIK